MYLSPTLEQSTLVEARRRAWQLLDSINRIDEIVSTWQRRHSSRRQFANLDSRILKDCGISEADRFIAINKPFWEA